LLSNALEKMGEALEGSSLELEPAAGSLDSLAKNGTGS
jgi:hypothetical protein